MSQYDGAISIDEVCNGGTGGMPTPGIVLSRAPRRYKQGDEETPNVRIVLVGETLTYHDVLLSVIPPFYVRLNRRRLTNQGMGSYIEKRLSFFKQRPLVLRTLR